MSVYEIIGLCRSGHHSVLNWIIRNQTFLQCTWDYKLNDIGNGFVHLNEANYDQHISDFYIKDLNPNTKVFYLGYENTPWDFTILNDKQVFQGNYTSKYENIKKIDHRILVIRDFFSSLTSRIKNNQKRIQAGEPEIEVNKTMNIREDYIRLWKNHAQAILDKKVSHIKFEDWLEKPTVRQEFLFENFRTKEIWDTQGIIGTSSSFGNREGVADRFDPNMIPDDIRRIVKGDEELYYLIGALGYPYRKL
jgi:hypothetical protein